MDKRSYYMVWSCKSKQHHLKVKKHFNNICLNILVKHDAVFHCCCLTLQRWRWPAWDRHSWNFRSKQKYHADSSSAVLCFPKILSILNSPETSPPHLQPWHSVQWSFEVEKPARGWPTSNLHALPGLDIGFSRDRPAQNTVCGRVYITLMWFNYFSTYYDITSHVENSARALTDENVFGNMSSFFFFLSQKCIISSCFTLKQ